MFCFSTLIYIKINMAGQGLVPPENHLYVYAILWHSPKNCEEKEQRAVPFEPLTALAELRKARAEISYTQSLCRGANITPHGFVCLMGKRFFSSPIEFSISFSLATPNDFEIFRFIKKPGFCFFRARAIFKISVNIHSCKKRHTARRERFMRVGR